MAYDLSVNGFLPLNPTPSTIRPPYNAFMNIANDLPKLIESHTIKQVVLNLELIEIDNKTTHEEYQTLYCMLTLIQAAYIWHNGEDNHETLVPKQISLPLKTVSEYLGIAPILTHASIDLYNWQYINPCEGMSLDNLKSAFTITGTKTESWFCLIMVYIEYLGRDIISSIVSGNINESLLKLSTQLDLIIATLDRMYEHCDPDIFFNILRKYLTGWTNNILFPNGMLLEGIGIKRFAGGSAGQSSLIQLFDIFLGITHQNTFNIEMRPYMPKGHRQLLIDIETKFNIKDHLNDSNLELFYTCINKLSKFRSHHIGLVQRYILNKSKSTVMSTEGTGGSNLMGLLKGYRIETEFPVSFQ